MSRESAGVSLLAASGACRTGMPLTGDAQRVSTMKSVYLPVFVADALVGDDQRGPGPQPVGDELSGSPPAARSARARWPPSRAVRLGCAADGRGFRRRSPRRPRCARLGARHRRRQGNGEPAHGLAVLHRLRGDVDVGAERQLRLLEGGRRLVDRRPGLADVHAAGLPADEDRDRLGAALGRPRRRGRRVAGLLGVPGRLRGGERFRRLGGLDARRLRRGLGAFLELGFGGGSAPPWPRSAASGVLAARRPWRRHRAWRAATASACSASRSAAIALLASTAFAAETSTAVLGRLRLGAAPRRRSAPCRLGALERTEELGRGAALAWRSASPAQRHQRRLDRLGLRRRGRRAPASRSGVGRLDAPARPAAHPRAPRPRARPSWSCPTARKRIDASGGCSRARPDSPAARPRAWPRPTR